MKKTTLILTGILTVSLLGNSTMAVLLSKKEVKTVTKEVEVVKKVPVEQNKKENKNLVDEYAKLALNFVSISKTGKSTDDYKDRLVKLKDNLSENIYARLVPEMSDKELEEKKNAEENDKSKITTTKVTKMDYTYIEKNENVYEVDVLYTLSASLNNRSIEQRYLCRMEVSKMNDTYMITNIFEDSMISDGIYS